METRRGRLRWQPSITPRQRPHDSWVYFSPVEYGYLYGRFNVVWRAIAMIYQTVRVVFLPLLLIVSTNCSSEKVPTTTGTTDAPVASVTVTPSAGSVAVGGTLQLTATLRDAAGNVVSGTVSWSSSNDAIAIVSANGLVSGVDVGVVTITATSGGQSDGAAVTAVSQNLITLDAATTYQTLGDWEATAQAGQVEHASLFQKYRDALYPLLINELGINRVRLEVRSQSENPVDYFGQLIDGVITIGTWLDNLENTVNDNADPSVIDPAGFQFSEVDHTIDNVISPLKQLVEQNGEQLYVNLTFVDFSPTMRHFADSDEYAEFMLAAFQHFQSKYGWVPDGIEILLEPDLVSDWTGTDIGNAIVATASRLAANGFTPDFIAPSTLSMARAVTFFDEMAAVPGALTSLTEISYHRYEGVSDGALADLASRAVANNLRTAMLEHIGSGVGDLVKDITLGRTSAWSQFTMAWPTSDGGGTGGNYYEIDDTDPSNPTIVIRSGTRFLRQFFKFIRRGAVRIEATSATSDVSPLAFINANGAYVVVIGVLTSQDFSITGLPAGLYGINYTTPSEYDVDLPDVTLADGEVLSANIPAPSLITVYRK